MYSYEIKQFLKERNYTITPEECMIIMDPNINCQITSVKYNATNNEYQIETSDGYQFLFKVDK